MVACISVQEDEYLQQIANLKETIGSVLVGVLAVVATVATYPVTYVQPGPQHGQQTVSPQQYRVLLQQAQPQVGAALAHAQPQSVIYQQQPQATQPVYQHQPQPQPQPQQYVVPRLKPRPLASQQAPGQPLQEPEDYDPNPQYQFAFDVKDDEFTNYQNRKEQREGGKISGSYSVVDSDGFIRTVKYTADPLEGFKAQVTREPTNIVVKIPTPPPQQGSLQQPQQYVVQRPAPAPAPAAGPDRQPYAQVFNSVASQPSPEQLAQLRALARQQFASAPQHAAAATPIQYQGVQPQVQYAPQPRPKAIKAVASGFAAQQPGPQVVYQAYQQ
ncbi:hypothetical protein C0J52_24774 [Blattella germanica]|nr:hypothetical protein C0J52_24774 [Blattella germanica]